ncbi:acyl-CoA synthetase short-chain family member 3, mitochondrial isoform X2 [Oryzias latipes]
MQLQIKHLVRLNPRVAVQRRRLPGRKLWSCCETATRPHAGAGAWSCRFYASDCAYSRAFSAAREQPDVFWGEKGLDIDWFEPWTKTLHVEDPVFPNWFVGGRLNMCYNAVDRHVESGRGEQPAIIHDSPVTGTKKIITYGELQAQVSKLAGVLVKNGVRQGDLVVIYMPMVPEAMIAMLACARIGAPHSLIFGGFASKELSVRIDHAKPKLMVTASFGVEPGRRVEYIPLVKKALEMSCHRPSKVLIYNRPNMEKVFLSPELSLDWDEEMASARPHECVSLPSNHPLYVLYTSGTTGTPKIWWAASDLGWVVGHSYICYAPLLHGNSTILYEGKPVGTPDPGAFFRVLSEHGASSMFTAPTAIRAIRQQDPHAANGKKYALNRLQSLFVAGERCDVETLEWAKKNFGVPVLDHWWQTETGSAITASFMGLGGSLTPPAGQAGKPVPGYNVTVIDDQMQEVKPRTLGNIVVRLPLPPGAALSLWENKSLFKKLYFSKFPGYYDTMDAGFLDEDGFLYIMSRSDDVINVAGHRLSAGALEESVLLHSAVGDCAVVGLEDSLKGHIPLALCVLKNEVRDTEEKVRTEIVKLVRDTVGPVAAFKNVLFVQGLPKTRSGKIPRSSLSNLINGKPYKVTPTIEDPEVFKDIERQVGKFQRS